MKILNPEIEETYLQEYFPDSPISSEKKSPLKSNKESKSPLLLPHNSVFGFDVSEDNSWEFNSHFNQITFNILELKNVKDQFQLTVKILATSTNVKNFDISMSKFTEFWKELKRKYNKKQNYFHNFDHGLNGINYSFI